MNGELFPAASPFPATREDALAALEAFVPRAGVYAKRRNHVVAGHPHVSRLSAALRCRLIREEEVRGAVAERFAPSTVEKFVQEVWWRLYWKGALEMRPGQWSDYRHALAAVPEEQRERAARIEAGESGVAIMDHFARELVETGYLHNHTRMWYAGFWVHTERLPWELGADFFLRHLLDGDAASNTLSWRWVAGLQTPGKTYLARRSNIEKYVDPDLLEGRTEGLERLERGSPNPEYADAPPRERAGPFPDSPARWSSRGQRWGWWLHDEDLSAETGELFEGSPAAVVAPPGSLPPRLRNGHAAIDWRPSLRCGLSWAPCSTRSTVYGNPSGEMVWSWSSCAATGTRRSCGRRRRDSSDSGKRRVREGDRPVSHIANESSAIYA